VGYEEQNIVFFKRPKAKNSLEIMRPFAEGLVAFGKQFQRAYLCLMREKYRMQPDVSWKKKFQVRHFSNRLGNDFCD